MEAKELMIGDWVRTFHGEYRRVTSINIFQHTSNSIDVCGKTYDEDRIEAVPLTEEILKANGWQLLSNYDREAYYDPNGVFSLDFRNGLFRLIIHGNIVIIEHVHELQHALRLCGLSDLADNFKIE